MKEFLIDEDDYECYMEKNSDKTHKGGIPNDFPCLMITKEIDSLLLHEYTYPKMIYCQGCKDKHYLWDIKQGKE